MKPVFIHIPKTGGTSIAKALNVSPLHRSVRSKGIKIEIRKAKKPYIFAFLRCPFDRAVSCFKFRQEWRKLQMEIDKNWKAPKNKTQHQLCFQAVLEGMDVNQFYENVNIDTLSHYQQVWFKQSWFVRGSNNVNYYDFANFSNEIGRLELALGRSIKLPHFFKTHHRGADELSAKSKSRIKDVYQVDFKLLDREGIPHAG